MVDPASEYRRLCQQHHSHVQPTVVAAFDRLPELDLSLLSLPPDTCEVLGKFLQTSTHVTKLSVADCLLEATALKNLLRGARESPSLHSVNLKGNNIHGESAKFLALAISRSNSIKRLVLEWNTLGQNTGAWQELCESVARNVCLVHLDLRSNHLTEDHAEGLATIITKNVSLVSLDLRWNKLGNTGGRRILHALQHNSTISHLPLDGNCVNRDILDLIETILVENRGRQNSAQPTLPEPLPNLNRIRQEPRLSSSLRQSEQLRIRLEHATNMLDATRRDLDARISAHQRDADENAALKREISGYVTRIRTMEDRLQTVESSFTSTHRDAMQRKDSDAEIIQDLRHRLAQSERALSEAEHHRERDEDNHSAQLAELHGKASSLQEQHASMSAQLKAARIQTERVIADEQRRRQQLEQQLKETHQQDIERSENAHAVRIAEKERAVAALQEEKSALEVAVVHQEAQHQADKVRTEADLSALKQRHSLEQTRLTQQMDVLREAHAMAQTSADEALAKQVSENTQLSQRILAFERRVNELANDKLQLNGEVDRLNTEVQKREESVRAHYRQVQDDNSNLRRNLQQLEDDLREKERQLNEARTQYERERTEWRDREQRRHDEEQADRRRRRDLLSAVQDFVGEAQ